MQSILTFEMNKRVQSQDILFDFYVPPGLALLRMFSLHEFQNFRIFQNFLYLIIAYHKNTFVCLNTAITRINKTETITENTNNNKHDEEPLFGLILHAALCNVALKNFHLAS